MQKDKIQKNEREKEMRKKELRKESGKINRRNREAIDMEKFTGKAGKTSPRPTEYQIYPGE